ncbi:cyclopropane fatty acyl phospholipid synthase [Candidatus Falkowbacteria bacterium]|nr:MAG: cyclopropane fatty acyl phospholipid synthase [Candidatus Falkowbacteria bacterium]
MPKEKQIVENLLHNSGITINGDSLADIKVKNDNFYKRVLSQGSLGLGESYVDGWWEAEKLDEFFYHLLRHELDKKVKTKFLFFHIFKAIIFNLGSKSKAFKIGEYHYDVSNKLYEKMLGRRMVYSSGYWKEADNLDQAQADKLDLVCKKLYLKPGMKILDIGCGWGSFCKYAASKYGVKVVGTTVSREQVELGKKLCAGLDVEIKLQDYRDISGKYDRIVSLGMFEHVGYKNYRQFMEIAEKSLKDDGLFLLHTIGGNKSVKTIDPWIARYIFPNSMLPSIRQIAESIENLFVMEDWHNFSVDYYKTLMAWFANFKKIWPELEGGKYDKKFYRTWKYYLLSSAGGFRSRKNQLWQIVLSKRGVLGGYKSIR